ncbi:MAG: family 16 glycosylhydrolase, partial [Anaerolineales bacterium]|nr:family 16 glycosylhydrolase [Anaerolineales bacterium]
PTLTAVEAFAFAPAAPSSGTFYLDQVKLYSNIGGLPSGPKASLSASSYSVDEGGTAVITVTLDMTSTQAITVSYVMTDITAVAGVDYTDTSSSLVFAPDEVLLTFTVATIDNSVYDPNKTIQLEIMNPVNAGLGSPKTAILTILENEAPPQPPIAPENVWVVENFENGLPSGFDGYGNPVGFVTWGSAANTFISTLAVTPTEPLAPPIWLEPNHLLQVDYDIAGGGYGGFTHAFSNEALDTWLSQDWANYEGVSFWVYGVDSGGEINFDIFDNRTTTGDSCERWTYIFLDDFSGWQYFEVPFTDFVRKGWQPDYAPNDGLTLTEVWGYAFGFPVGVGAQTNYIENVGLKMETLVVDDFATGVPMGTDSFGNTIGFMTWGNVTNTYITTTQVVSTSPLNFPLPLGGNNFLQVDYDIAAGGWGGFTHLFTNETVDTWISQNWITYEGMSFWVYGTESGGDINIDIFDNKTTSGDSCERWTYIFPDNFSGWRYLAVPFSDFTRKGWQPGGAPNDGLTLTEVWGYAFGFPADVGARTNYLELVTTYGNVTPPPQEPKVSFGSWGYSVMEGEEVTVTVKLNVPLTYPVTVTFATEGGTTIPDRDYLVVSETFSFAPGEIEQSFGITTLDDIKYEGDQTVGLRLSDPISVTLGAVDKVDLTIEDNDPYDPMLVEDFETYPYLYDTWGLATLSTTEVISGSGMALPGQWLYENILQASTAEAGVASYSPPGNGFGPTFAQSADWSAADGLSLWYYGQNSGETITVTVDDNRLPDPGPTGWELVWSDEFSGTAGSAVDNNNWTHEIGGEGWGNNELEYYTDSTENSYQDGAGNLVIKAQEVDPEDEPLDCHYGECEYTSARLITAGKFEMAYGRVEASIKVPYGQGIWPAFWMLGNDIFADGWPQCGEIDIMENIGSEPNIVHGTIHGPGYSGGNGIGSGYTLDTGNFSDDFHTFAVEWEPTEIRWYVDDDPNPYYTVTVDDIPDGTEWVFDHPFFIILNVAVGGAWPGYPDATTVFPQTMSVEYVRVYQAADTAERFDASFVDSFSGWQQVQLPFDVFTRSTFQPDGAPNDGLGLDEVWGYSFGMADDSTATLDQIRLYTGEVDLPTVQLETAESSVLEGSGATITVTLDQPYYMPVSVDYATADGTALAGQDYITSTGTLTFPAGTTSQTFEIVTNQDTLDELDETVLITLSNPDNAILGAVDEATLTIEDDDEPVVLPVVSFAQAAYGVTESGTAVITVTLDITPTSAVTVTYTTADGTAIAGSDYLTSTGTLVFAPGETRLTFEVATLEDATQEVDETILLTLSNPEGATLGEVDEATLTIVDPTYQVFMPFIINKP